MKRMLLLLTLVVGFSSAQIRSQFISVLSPPPYQVGDTIKFCSICTKNIPAESLFVSTNLFSPPTKPAPIIFSGSKSIIINNPDISWKYLLNHTSEQCDTISFVTYYAPFSKDSIFYIKFKMVGYDISELTIENIDNRLSENIKLVHTTMSKQSTGTNYVNLLGRIFEKECKCLTLTKKGLVNIGTLK